MSIQNLLTDFRHNPQFMANVRVWRTLPPRPAQYAPLPPTLHPLLQQAIQARGIADLYSHQAQAVDAALQGQNVVVVTPTASGKTLCYNLPVFHTLLHEPGARALYLFPTKALAQDQLDEIGDWRLKIERQTTNLQSPIPNLQFSTYDGDTPAAQRSTIRQNARLILTNPDMLHMGILPFHTGWVAFFSGLRYVVIDELHTYRGVFGSHVANVLRRLRRLCTVYGSQPQFICTSATIANPQELAERLLEQPVIVIDENGAPSAEKHILLYNPPLYDAERGLRRSSLLETQELAATCILNQVQTIVFGRARLTTEVLLTYLRERVGQMRDAEYGIGNAESSTNTIPNSELRTPNSSIKGYRGGYLPSERRAIEAGLRRGEVRGVVATNALELGIDIGQLQAAILCGYPGSIASTWQQMGRAGRTQEASLALLVATSGALDQYIMQHPEFIFERSPEHALINPDNLMLLVDQIRCAAYELPFAQDESFGASPFTADVLQLLVEQCDLHQHGSRYFWSGDGSPARQVSLRSIGSNRVLIQIQNMEYGVRNSHETPFRTPNSELRIIGEIDRTSACMLVHDGAIYLHEGQSYQVERLNLELSLAQVTPVSVDYYTEATAEIEIEVLAEQERRLAGGALVAHGDVQVRSQVVGFRRIKRFTHENLGVQPLSYPPQELETSGYWFQITPATQLVLEQAGQWFDSLNDYGPNWQEQRKRVRARDQYRCTQCGAPEPANREHDVHHLIPFRTFGYAPGLNEHYRLANRLENLTLVCRTCHRRLEAGMRVRSGLDGLAYTLGNLAPLHLMCAPQDIGMSVVRGKPNAEYRIQNTEFTAESLHPPPSALCTPPLPTIYIYERIAAGLGFSARLYELHDELLVAARQLIHNCGCRNGCPACVGPVLETPQVQLPTKRLTLALLDVLTGGAPAPTVKPPVDELTFY